MLENFFTVLADVLTLMLGIVLYLLLHFTTGINIGTITQLSKPDKLFDRISYIIQAGLLIGFITLLVINLMPYTVVVILCAHFLLWGLVYFLFKFLSDMKIKIKTGIKNA